MKTHIAGKTDVDEGKTATCLKGSVFVNYDSDVSSGKVEVVLQTVLNNGHIPETETMISIDLINDHFVLWIKICRKYWKGPEKSSWINPRNETYVVWRKIEKTKLTDSCIQKIQKRYDWGV